MAWNIKLTTKQRMFVDANEDEVFYGGAAGGGKSYAQIIDTCLKASQYPGIKQLILRRSFPELDRSIIQTFLEIVPKEMYAYNQSKHLVRFFNGSLCEFGFCENDNDVTKYMSAEYDIIRLDEATHFSEYQVLYLKSRIRGANKFPKQLKCSSNPGNQGHAFFRERFIEPAPPMTEFTARSTSSRVRPQTRIFIPSTVYENKFLMEADPDYIARLEDLPPDERRQLLEGDWYVFQGQFFSEFSREHHVTKELPDYKDPKNNWRIYFTMDYGLDCFAGYFVAENPRGKAVAFGEIHEPNVIISDAAKMIKDKMADLGIKKVDQFLAPGDLWNRRQETGRSVADIFYENGIMLYKTSRDRPDGWAAMKEWLKPYKDEQDIPTANLQIHESCVHLIKDIPLLQYDDRRPSDCLTTPHEITHGPDAIRGFCVYRSRGNSDRPEEPAYIRKVNRELNSFNSNEMFNVYSRKEDYGSSDNNEYNPMYL